MVLDKAGEAGIGQILLHTVGQNKKLIFISNQRQMESVIVCLFSAGEKHDQISIFKRSLWLPQ